MKTTLRDRVCYLDEPNSARHGGSCLLTSHSWSLSQEDCLEFEVGWIYLMSTRPTKDTSKTLSLGLWEKRGEGRKEKELNSS